MMKKSKKIHLRQKRDFLQTWKNIARDRGDGRQARLLDGEGNEHECTECLFFTFVEAIRSLNDDG